MLCSAGHSQMPYPAKMFFSVTNVPSIAVCATEIRCSCQKENPNFTQELEHNLPHVIWAGMTSDYLIRPYFLDRPVNASSYSAMLGTSLIPQLRLLDDVLLQHDGAHAHFALSMRDVFNEHPGRCICHGSPSPAPLAWPPYSPEVTTPDNWLWSIIKGRVDARQYNEDFHTAVEDAFGTINPKILRRMSQRTWRRIRLCVQHQGTHMDSLDM